MASLCNGNRLYFFIVVTLIAMLCNRLNIADMDTPLFR